MFQLKRFLGAEFQRFNAIVDNLHCHLSGTINLVGSATLPLPEVCAAQSLPGSFCRVEGHLDQRYFPGTEPIDQAERLAEDSIRAVFGLPEEYWISIQPHSATQANHAVWNAMLEPGDRVMGLALNDGGHISHSLGLPEGVKFDAFCFDEDGIDYGATAKKIHRLRPRLVVCGSSSYPLQFDFDTVVKITRGQGAHLHADLAHYGPYVAAGLHSSPFPEFDSITLDSGKNFRGPKGGVLIFKSEIESRIRRQIFPIGQSSPNQSSLLAKACMFEFWKNSDLTHYASSLIDTAQWLEAGLQEYAIPLLFNPTESHLILVDVMKLGLTGAKAEEMLQKKNILANRNSIPSDRLPAHIASGLRIGTTTLTILGYDKADTKALGACIAQILLGEDPAEEVLQNLIDRYHRNISSLHDLSIPEMD